jgi:uncharacterized protein (DUF362 family)
MKDLNEFYSDYDILKEFLFDLFKKSDVFKEIGSKKKILLKPNWVYHNTNETDKLCLITNPNFILAILEFILQFNPSSVVIGDAPIQSCCWNLLHSDSFLQKISKLQEQSNIMIKIVDFRNEKWEQKRTLQRNCRKAKDYILYDLRTDSLLEPLSLQNKSFRVGDYNPEETIKNHKKGTHKYLVAKEVIEADVVINLPKLKTHQKAGVTNGLKNYVGIIGEKSYLAHNSSNSSKSGGDCYPGNNIFRRVAEYFSDISYKHKGSLIYYLFHYMSSIIWRLAPRSAFASLSGSWYGNDTIWRMVLDIHKIVSYGSVNGKIETTPQRKLITISDAIIAGQGDGPLKPIPHPMGMISISDNDLFLDFIMAELMGFDSSKIPLLQSIIDKERYSEFQIFFDDKRILKKDLNNYAIKTIPPRGWAGYIERESKLE